MSLYWRLRLRNTAVCPLKKPLWFFGHHINSSQLSRPPDWFSDQHVTVQETISAITLVSCCQRDWFSFISTYLTFSSCCSWDVIASLGNSGELRRHERVCEQTTAEPGPSELEAALRDSSSQGKLRPNISPRLFQHLGNISQLCLVLPFSLSADWRSIIWTLSWARV